MDSFEWLMQQLSILSTLYDGVLIISSSPGLGFIKATRQFCVVHEYKVFAWGYVYTIIK